MFEPEKERKKIFKGIRMTTDERFAFHRGYRAAKKRYYGKRR